jgi:hypothetical protein
MKLLSICLIAAALLSCLTGCASSDSEGGYGAHQQMAQHAGYDPTSHAYGTRY